jgi:transcriptional regulator with XRE-family HTH domain
MTHLDHDAIMAELRKAILVSDIPPKFLAIRAGVSSSAVYALANGKTQWPRHTTLFALLDVLGLHLTLTPSTQRRKAA